MHVIVMRFSTLHLLPEKKLSEIKKGVRAIGWLSVFILLIIYTENGCKNRKYSKCDYNLGANDGYRFPFSGS